MYKVGKNTARWIGWNVGYKDKPSNTASHNSTWDDDDPWVDNDPWTE